MKGSYLIRHGKTGIELVEEATQCVRRATPRALAFYFIGSVPFVAALLFFWAYMSKSPLASEHLAGMSLGLAILFLWMKTWQACFTQAIMAELSGNPGGMSLNQWGKILLVQAILQPSALFVLPVATLTLLPLPWAYAFYQNATALDDGKKDLLTVFKRAWQQASLWPGQNAVLLTLLSGFGFYVFLNWVAFCLYAPQLLKMFFGIESDVPLNPLSLINSTLFATTVGLTYLCVDPLLKTCYTLRCFYGGSLQSGEDLKAELRFLRRGPAIVIVTVLLFLSTTFSHGQNTNYPAAGPRPEASSGVTRQELDRSIDEVLKQQKYTWRYAPTKEPASASNGAAGQFFHQIGKMLKKVFQWIFDLVGKIYRYLRARSHSHQDRDAGLGWISSELGLLFIALAVVACILAVVILRLLKKRRKAPAVSSSILVSPVPHIEDEYIAADQLPEDRWIALGRDLVAQGELRAALRAFYLASLAHLAAAHLVTISRGKSNRDYERELKRRGHSRPDLPALFGENVRAFDRAWYGLHEVNIEIVEGFLDNLQKIKGLA